MMYTYRRYTVKPASYRLASGRWAPQASLIRPDGGEVHWSTVLSGRMLEFATEDEANAYALQLARQHIDKLG